MNDLSQLTFVTTVTTNRYVRFARIFVDSVLRTHPWAKVIVYHSALSPSRLAALVTSFPTVRFLRSGELPAETKDVTISMKVSSLRRAVSSAPRGTPLAFMDCDTLLLRSLVPYFSRLFDFAYTWKPTGYPLNTGVVLGRVGVGLEQLVDDWWRRNNETLLSPTLRSAANRTAGGADQYSLLSVLLGRPVGVLQHSLPSTTAADIDGPRSVIVSGRQVDCVGYPCAEINQTECEPVGSSTHVVHYKSGWHQILLDDLPFTATRFGSTCREQHRIWRQHDASARTDGTARVAAAAAKVADCYLTRLRIHSSREQAHAACLALAVASVLDVRSVHFSRELECAAAIDAARTVGSTLRLTTEAPVAVSECVYVLNSGTLEPAALRAIGSFVRRDDCAAVVWLPPQSVSSRFPGVPHFFHGTCFVLALPVRGRGHATDTRPGLASVFRAALGAIRIRLASGMVG